MTTNEFQQLVFLIQHQLRERPGTCVTESKKLIDQNTGKKREVDIVVELSEGDVPFVIAFETRSRSRKPTIEWVEQQIKKHEHLSDKLVLVANRPFATDAIDLARRHRVETIELNDATKVDWPAFIDQYTELFLGGFEFSIKSYSIEYEALDGAATLSTDEPVSVTQGALSGPLPEAIQSVLTNRSLFSELAMDAWYKLPLDQRREEHTINVDATPPSESPWELRQGSRRYLVTHVRAEVSVRVGTASLVLNRASYKGTLVAHASSRLQKGAWDGQLVRLVMTEKPGQKAQCAMMIVGADTSKAIVKRFDFKGTEGASG